MLYIGEQVGNQDGPEVDIAVDPDPLKILSMEEMVGDGDVIFAATGITPGDFLGGVLFLPGHRAETQSIVMRAKTKTIRHIRTSHFLPNKPFLNHV